MSVLDEKRKYRVALVGCGVISETHLTVLTQGNYAEVAALCDTKIEKAEKRAKRFCPNAKIYTDYESMLTEVKPDAVHICTPHYLHAKMAISALEKGINVFLEKPACMTGEEIDMLLQAEKQSCGRITVSFQNRKNPAMLKMDELIESFGGRAAVRGGRGMVAWNRDEAYYSDDWHGKRATEGGGVLINQAIHTLDLVLYFCGKPKSVCGHIANRHLRGKIEVEDSADMLITLESGANCYFAATTAYSVGYSPNFVEVMVGNHSLILYGDTLLCDGKRVDVEKLGHAVGKTCYGSGHGQIIPEYYEALLTGGEMPVTLTSAMDAVRVLLATYRSNENDIPIEY